ncbi:hypothetical protein [Pseudomonas chlororaphis]|uniref:Tetratricopeptide repeat-like domain-containing protein n=1 Tax=Pseudomonas chlororaphis TaxID=587753 RepID=A0AAX3G1K6_9PSED|nr:hypothetical protein [Pseudomonas chlororaphis]AZC35163.1 hypothetical protein C4K37_0754 [Pseudomonas chlororaphis subsp. piscium]AZC41704.1 hypothetical protein C4K36_0757 [Pseudomonas chlororaphis subsp. piscium]WDG73674.1 hypothetical protein PUP65_04745 [Pseudomonas chlororaphis]WDH28689.1 hypothetical protein PUP81_29560 [Pseudomonas chlororaphis]WDH72195.1 hypothetical protein PUP78_04745 [Pseudomonas chlororaphis]
MTTEEQIARLESEVAKLKDRGKDGWDKFGVACSALIPIAIAGVGGYYSYHSQHTATAVADIRAAAESKIKQAELVSKFFEPLMGNDPKRSEFAVRALLVAAPDYGPTLVRVVAENTRAPAEAAYASDALSERRDALIRQMFSDDARQRVDGYQQLLASWGSDELLIPAVIAYGSGNTSNGNGIYNSLVLLSHMQRDTIQKRKVDIIAFTKLVEGKGDKIRERADVLRSRLGA